MRILVVTSCTGDKVVDHEDKLTLEDFRKGPEHVAQREAELAEWIRPAEAMYSGMQHARLMRGVKAFREQLGTSVDLELRIVSAGYGAVMPDHMLAPYEATFIGMKKAELREWANLLGLPMGIRQILQEPYDLGLVLLGEDYVEACALDDRLELGGPTLLFCGKGTARKLPKLDQLRIVLLGTGDAKRFSCGMVGLKGEVAARLLEGIAAEPERLRQLAEPTADVLAIADSPARERTPAVSGRKGAPAAKAVPNPLVKRVIQLPDPWRNRPRRRELRYFIPEWDDQVDPDFDF